MAGKEPRASELNNLNASLHSIISGEGNVNIPFADDEDARDKTIGKSSDSMSSNDSYEQVNYSSRRRPPLVDRRGTSFKLAINNTGTEASGESDTDDNQLAMERRDKPGPLVSETFRATDAHLGVLRRNSISMPVLNEVDLDSLRQLHMQVVSQETLESKESLTKITVSCNNKRHEALSRLLIRLFQLSSSCSFGFRCRHRIKRQ